ncbi:hypothetical protein PHYPSEUDO_000517 [Phytophthora pseudosyringae]|uniref:Transmembrane protein n=1 Tax=Phytophthora pseudosyringae TaxID=221518 RepID=A0A8T1VZ26_9STRA|nr:hypothetical protein PHYPSEUDO_000517 [Phytophthora pseudosyringae]
MPPPPSPARKEHLLAWTQPAKAESPAAKPEGRQCRRSSMQAVPATERKQSTTATYTEQFLRRRRSQQELADAARDEQLRSPRANGSRRMERRRSCEDAGAGAATARRNSLGPLPQCGAAAQKPENGHHENGTRPIAAAAADMAVEKKPPRTTDVVTGDAVASAVSGKGIAATSDGSLATIDRQNPTVAKVAMTKKRKASCCGRAGVALAAVAGVVTVTAVAGGIAVCRVYPSSPAAASIRFAAGKVEESLLLLSVELRNQVGPYARNLGEVLRVQWRALLLNRGLKQMARAAEVLVNEELRGSSGFTQLTAGATVCFELIEDMPGRLRPAVSDLTGALKLSMEWTQTQAQTVVKLIKLELCGDSELLRDGVRAVFLAALSSLTEALRQGKEWTKASLDHVLEWTGLQSDVSDVNLPSDQFLAPLETTQAGIQNVGRGLTAQESLALQDVMRFEKRRVTIASDTNAILAQTRDFALESVVNVKMAALEIIEHRLKQLEEQYARSFDEALKDYERTSGQVEKEGGAELLAEIAVESQAQVVAAAALKRDLTPHEGTVDGRPVVIEDSQDKRASDDQSHIGGAQLAEHERLSEVLPDSPELTEQGSVDDVLDGSLGYEEEVQIVAELVKEGLMTVELTQAPEMEHSSYDEALGGGGCITEEQIQIVAEVADKDQLAVEVPVPGMEKSSLSEASSEGDHASEIIARLSEERQLGVTMETSGNDEVVGEVKEALVTDVLMELTDAQLVAEHTQVEVTKLLASHNLSELDIANQYQQENRVEAHFKVPVDGADMELVVELNQFAGESAEEVKVERLLPDVRTRVATQPESEKENNIEEQKMHKTELMQEEKHQVHEQILDLDGIEIEVQTQQLNEETTFKVETNFNEAEAVVADLEHVEEAGLTNEAPAEKGVQEHDVGVVGEAQQEHTEDVHVEATFSEINSLETERVVVAREIHELQQLEQVLLQNEGERVRVEEELRAIAEEEEFWLQSELASAEGEPTQDYVVPSQHRIDTIDATDSVETVVDLKTNNSRSTFGIPASLTQIGLLSVVFLGLAALAAYLLVRYRKRGLLARPPHRRKRWQRLAHESDAEEVVLLPDDSSDEEENTDHPVRNESYLEGVELMSSVEVKATGMVSSEGEDAEKEESSDVVEEKEEVAEEEEAVVSDFVSTRSRTGGVERVKTTKYTVDHPATPNSDASADESDTANASVSTPPASKLETPDTSQRTRRRRRQIRT